MRALVTGGLGVIGSFAVREFVRRGIPVATYSRSGDVSLLTDIQGEFQPLIGDIRDTESLVEALRAFGADRIVHLAATLPKLLSERPELGTSINVNGTIAVMEAAKRAEVRRVVVASSQGVYAPAGVRQSHPHYEPVNEDYPVGPSSYYGATKLMTEYIVRHYRELFGVDSIVLRFSQTYGPGKIQRHGALALMSRLIESAAAGQSLSVARGGDQWMDMIYNADVGEGLVRAALVENPSERTIQLGSGHGLPLRDIASTVAEVTGTSATLDIADGLDPVGIDGTRINYLVFDISRAKEVLGWEPRFGIAEATEHYLGMMEKLKLPLLGGAVQ